MADRLDSLQACQPERFKTKMTNRGFSLIEMMIVLAIAAILMATLGFQYANWKGKYNTEKAIKDVYSTLTNARSLALQQNRAVFFEISPDNRHYMVSQDDSNGVAKTVDGDGIFEQQKAWPLIQAVPNANDLVNFWGSPTVATDTILGQLSKRLELRSNSPAGFVTWTDRQMAGLLVGWFAFPNYGWTFRLGFDKRGMIRNMLFSIDPVTGTVMWNSTTNIQNAVPSDQWLNLGWGRPTICIFTDYTAAGRSAYDPDYDCIVVGETKISLGKLTNQNTAGNWCNENNCVVK